MHVPMKASVRLGRAFFIITLFVSGSMADAQSLGPNLPGLDIPGLDIPEPNNPLTLNPSLANDEAEIAHCRRACELNPRCMAFTWVRRSDQTPGRCFFKASSRIFGINPSALPSNPNTVSGVKTYSSSACWARHIFNQKLCDVFPAGATGNPGDQITLECPPGSRPASISNRSIPGRFDRFCVVRRANDPGGLPNCTDAFGGESHEADVLGNSVNQACLDAEWPSD